VKNRRLDESEAPRDACRANACKYQQPSHGTILFQRRTKRLATVRRGAIRRDIAPNSMRNGSRSRPRDDGSRVAGKIARSAKAAAVRSKHVATSPAGTENDDAHAVPPISLSCAPDRARHRPRSRRRSYRCTQHRIGIALSIERNLEKTSE